MLHRFLVIEPRAVCFEVGVRFFGLEPKYPETGPLVDGMSSWSKSINHSFEGDLGYFMCLASNVYNALGLGCVYLDFHSV